MTAVGLSLASPHSIPTRACMQLKYVHEHVLTFEESGPSIQVCEVANG